VSVSVSVSVSACVCVSVVINWLKAFIGLCMIFGRPG
jgi:hypothetical protein